MTTEIQDTILQLERMLQETFDFVNSNKSPELGDVRQRLTRNLLQDMNFLRARSGNVTAIFNSGASITNPLVDGAAAVPSIMGKPIGRKLVVAAETTSVTASETAKFVSQVDDLYKGFFGLKDKDLLNILGKPGGVPLIRGVAKKAGMLDWESRQASDIDIMFFADIRASMKDSAESNKKLDEVETKLEAEQSGKKKKTGKSHTKAITVSPDADDEDEEELKIPAKKSLTEDDDE